MRHLITFIFCSMTFLAHSQEAHYDSLYNINRYNYTKLVGQTLFYPSGEIVVSDLFWSNKKGRIYKPKAVIAGYLYSKFSLNEAVINKHFVVEKIISGSNPLLKTRIRENNDIVYVNLNALFKNTATPVLFVDGYIQKCNKLYLYKTLYVDKNKCDVNFTSSNIIENTMLATFYCNNIRVTTKQNQGGIMLLSERSSSHLPVEIDVVDYLKASVGKSEAEELIRQTKIRLEHEARVKAERKKIMDSIADVRMKEQRQADLLALEQMKEKYMHKTWYYRRGDFQYQRFKPIEVIDIQVRRDSTGHISFPMKLKYKGSDYVVSHYAVIFDDGQCTFDMAFHNIPPEKEYPTVRHWKAIKEYKLVLGMNKQEVQLVWGYPTDINTSKGSWGVHEQWVYPSSFGGRSRYVYFKNGRLSAIQE